MLDLVNEINNAVININTGRRSWAIRGKEEEGRALYEEGIAEALSIFKTEQASSDPRTIMIAENTFVSQELLLCDETEKYYERLTRAKQRSNEALLAYQILDDNKIYSQVDKTFSHHKKYRINGFPKDAFHIACITRKIMLKKILRVHGIDPIEKTLLKQRLSNMSTAQSGYIEKQKKALEE